MKPKVQALGGPVARERRDGGQVKLSTFIPLNLNPAVTPPLAALLGVLAGR
jgi:hypothetical protein